MMDLVAYKILTATEWVEFQRDQIFQGSAVDKADGFIHLSTAAQLEETLAKYYAGQIGLTIAEVDLAPLADMVRWEKSRHDQLFPHIYGPLPMSAINSAQQR